jgi:type II secretory pathway component PulF
MPRFSYEAKKGPTDRVSGVIDAATADEAVDKLSDQGLIPVRLEETSATASASQAAGSPVASAARGGTAKASRKQIVLFSRIRSKEITLFGRMLAGLLRAGVPILKSLWVISEQSENPRMKDMLTHAQDEIRNGRTLSDVLAQYPSLFPSIYIAMVRTGEDSGTLPEALLRVSEYRQKQEEIFSRVRTAMAYPILMAVTGAGTVAFMLTFVIPKLSGLFSTMGGALPMPTRILMSVSAVFQNRFFWIAVGAALIGLVALLKAKPAAVKSLWSRVSLKLPIIKGFVIKSELARLSRTLELLIKSGTPILRSIEITAPVLGNTVLSKSFAAIREEIAGGGTLGKSLRERREFPLFMTNLILVGEEAGHLDESLSEIAQYYERETDEAIKVMTSLLEPLMILVMGLIVGFIVIAMLLPMFELNMMVK